MHTKLNELQDCHVVPTTLSVDAYPLHPSMAFSCPIPLLLLSPEVLTGKVSCSSASNAYRTVLGMSSSLQDNYILPRDAIESQR